MLKKTTIIALLGVLTLTSEGFSQVFTCDGVISNRPCDQYLTPIPKSDAPMAKERSKRESLIHNLSMKAVESQKNYGVQIDYSEASEICRDLTKTIEDCRAIVKETEDRIEQRLAARNFEKTNEASPDETTQSSSETNTEINIIQNDDYDDTYWDHRPHHPGHSSDHPDRPDHNPVPPIQKPPEDLSGIADQIPQFPKRAGSGSRGR